MKTYFSFQSNLSEETIRYRISLLPRKSISAMTTEGQFFGNITKTGKFEIGCVPNSMSRIAFFQGKVKKSKDKVAVEGYFGPSVKTTGIQGLIVFLFMMIFGAGIKEFLIAPLFLGAFHLMQIESPPSNSVAHKMVLKFIAEELNGTEI